MLHAHDFGMTNGDYVFYTIDMLPDEEVIDPESVWKGNDGRDAEAKEAFESVFHVSIIIRVDLTLIRPTILHGVARLDAEHQDVKDFKRGGKIGKKMSTPLPIRESAGASY